MRTYRCNDVFACRIGLLTLRFKVKHYLGHYAHLLWLNGLKRRSACLTTTVVAVEGMESTEEKQQLTTHHSTSCPRM
jgi:hypothetical protein